MALVEVKVPDIGDFKDVEIIELLVKPGDTVKVDQSLVTVESDKASMEIPSTQAGVVKELKVKIGDKISEGSVIAVLEGEGTAEGAEISLYYDTTDSWPDLPSFDSATTSCMFTNAIFASAGNGSGAAGGAAGFGAVGGAAGV